MEFLLFLSGPIIGCTYEGCSDWRNYVANKLPSNIQAISPMRGKEFLSNQGVIGKENLRENTSSLITSSGITTRDRFDIARCDVVLMNLIGATQITIGTMIELGWADAYRKPVVLAIEKQNIHHHPIVCGIAGFVVPTLDEAIQTAMAVLMPNYRSINDNNITDNIQSDSPKIVNNM